MSNDDQPNSLSEQDDKPGEVNTGGGLYAGGDIATGGGDFTGRDKHVHGDEVHGDKVMGDKVVVHEAPKPRIPLERPPRAAHFQDRKDALAKLIADLRPGQVITLCGPGGIGKSALSAEAVWQLIPGAEPSALFPDGVLFHSFYNQPQSALALEHIARSFGEEIKPSPKEAAQRALAGRRALLILDGTEQADDLRLITDIRDQCGVLVTSRKRQDQIDQRLDVEPLPLDDAVALLQAWGGSRAINASVVRRVAELVGRLPLALRLIGRYLSENEEDAGDYLAWLEATPLSALHQGQRCELSVDLLLARSLEQVSETARRVLGMVGLLALVPFTREPIAVALNLSTGESRQAFGELVNYGLLLRRTEAYEVSHALIHIYASHQLAASTDTKVLERLAAYYTTFINDQQSAFNQLDRVRLHVLALLCICDERKAWGAVISLALAIKNYLDLQCYWTDLITVIKAGLTAVRATKKRREEAAWLSHLGNTYMHLGQIEQALAYHQQALAIDIETDEYWGEGLDLCNLGGVYYSLGQVEQAIVYYQQALTIVQKTPDSLSEGTILGNLGAAYYSLGQVEQAIAYYKQALAIAQTIGDRRNEGAWLGHLGNMYHSLGQSEQALVYHKQALAIAQAIGDRLNEGAWLGNLGNTYHSLGQFEQALAYHKQALAIAQESGGRQRKGALLDRLGDVYYSLGQFEQAIVYYQQALTVSQEIGNRQDEGVTLGNLGSAYVNLGQVKQARQAMQQALYIFEEIKSPQAEIVRRWLASLKGW